MVASAAGVGDSGEVDSDGGDAELRSRGDSVSEGQSGLSLVN